MNQSALTLLADAYPQRRDWQDLSWLDQKLEWLRTAVGARWTVTPARSDGRGI